MVLTLEDDRPNVILPIYVGIAEQRRNRASQVMRRVLEAVAAGSLEEGAEMVYTGSRSGRWHEPARQQEVY